MNREEANNAGRLRALVGERSEDAGGEQEAMLAGSWEASTSGRSRLATHILGFLANPYLTLVSRLALGAIFILSGMSKLGIPDTFAESINSYAMSLPPALVRIMAVGLPPLELAIGVWLLVGLFTRLAASISAGLMVVFLIALIQAALRGLDPNCGCFAGAESNALALAMLSALGPVGTWLADEKIGWPIIVRDAVFLLMSIHLIKVPTIFALDNWRSRGEPAEEVADDVDAIEEEVDSSKF